MDKPLPADDYPFSADEDLPGYGDGDWPEWPAQQMLQWMPEDIQERFGSVAASMVSGPCLGFDPESESELVAALKEAGYICIRDDELIRRANGQ